MEYTLDCSEKVRIFANFVKKLTRLSKCKNRKVACIICDSELQQIYSMGINGTAKGSEKDCLCVEPVKYSCIHAEANALIKLTERIPHKILICSLMPCTQCASMIINEPGGFDAVLYIQDWKEPQAAQELINAGIQVGQIMRDGHINWCAAALPDLCKAMQELSVNVEIKPSDIFPLDGPIVPAAHNVLKY